MKNGFLKFMVCGAMMLGIEQLAMGATCTSWSFGPTTVSTGSILTGSANDPCTDYGLTFSNFTVYIGAGFSTPQLFSISATFGSNGVITFSDSEGQGQDIDVEFQVTPGVSSLILNMGAGTSITETICTKQFTPSSSCSGVGGTVLGTGNVTSSSTAATIQIQQGATDWILKDVNGSSTFSQTFTPEPLSFSLMGAGLLAIGLIRRRRRQ